MSLLNVHVTPQLALVAVDTDGIGPAGHFEICKLYPVAHANTILAGQGERRFLLEAFSRICLADRSVDYDVIVEAMPGLLRVLAAGARQHGAPDHRYAIAVVGYSPAEGCVCGRWYEGVVTRDQFEVHSLGSRVGPWPFEDRAPVPDSVENHVALARRQTAWHKSKDYAGGGRLILAELTPDQLNIRSPCRLEWEWGYYKLGRGAQYSEAHLLAFLESGNCAPTQPVPAPGRRKPTRAASEISPLLKAQEVLRAAADREALPDTPQRRQPRVLR
ncbi:hypothetical protein [Lysobacter sp. FW306-1B-D06B]|uniref:hypothetical protein n=1 Tax=Lysobacter sp. FW306-1B-D06B TaxID=3140250 RepID=UPI003140746B